MTNLLREDTHRDDATPTQKRLAREHAERMKRWHTIKSAAPPPPPAPPPQPLKPLVQPEPIRPDWIAQWLDDWRAKVPPMLSWRHVQQVVAERFGMTRSELVSVKRSQHVARARQVAMFLCLEIVPAASLKAVGRWFGRDHTTVLHARDRTRERIADDPDFASMVDKIKQTIKGSEA